MAHTAKCLGPNGVNVLTADDKLTPSARDAFTVQVVALLTSGNRDGKGAKVSSLTGVPFPPPSGVKLLDPDRLIISPSDPLGDLFWFDPSPFAPLTFDTLRDPLGGYQSTIVDGLYLPLMKAMNIAGNAAAPPILDFTGLLPPDVAAKLTLADLPKIAVAIPTGLLGLQALGIDLGDIPAFLANVLTLAPLPSFPSVPAPPSADFDFIVFPELFKSLLTLPLVLLPELVKQLSVNIPKLLTPSPPALFELALGLVFPLVLKILEQVGLLTILPKLLVATFIVILQNLAIALLCMGVSQVIGTGLVVKTIGAALGLA